MSFAAPCSPASLWDTESIEAAVTGSLETMESVALTGGEERRPEGCATCPPR